VTVWLQKLPLNDHDLILEFPGGLRGPQFETSACTGNADAFRGDEHGDARFLLAKKFSMPGVPVDSSRRVRGSRNESEQRFN
jgi:hypothetical protein